MLVEDLIDCEVVMTRITRQLPSTPTASTRLGERGAIIQHIVFIIEKYRWFGDKL